MMMDGGMGWTMGLGWLGGALVVLLLVVALVVAVRAVLPVDGSGTNGRAGKALLIVLAVIGALALATVLAGSLMHWGMMGGGMM